MRQRRSLWNAYWRSCVWIDWRVESESEKCTKQRMDVAVGWLKMCVGLRGLYTTYCPTSNL